MTSVFVLAEGTQVMEKALNSAGEEATMLLKQIH